MRRKNFAKMACPVARGLERVGEWWSILILRDTLAGLTKFDQLQDNLGIAPGMLTRRLGALVKAGLLTKKRYQNNPPRYEYLPTDRGRDFREVLLALTVWGNKHFAPEGPNIVVTNRKTGKTAEPAFMDRKTGKPLDDYIFTRVTRR